MTPPTQSEIEALSILYPGQYIGVANVSNTMFSIARHYGGMELDGHTFTYFHEVDQLWRDDVLKKLKQTRKDHAKQAKKKAPPHPDLLTVARNDGQPNRADACGEADVSTDPNV